VHPLRRRAGEAERQAALRKRRGQAQEEASRPIAGLSLSLIFVVPDGRDRPAAPGSA
jgi:hypothetical protein